MGEERERGGADTSLNKMGLKQPKTLLALSSESIIPFLTMFRLFERGPPFRARRARSLQAQVWQGNFTFVVGCTCMPSQQFQGNNILRFSCKLRKLCAVIYVILTCLTPNLLILSESLTFSFGNLFSFLRHILHLI